MAVILENQVGQIALVERALNQPVEGGKLALPGGYVEFDQTFKEAATDETLQETGHTIAEGSLCFFALMDGPTTLPGRQNEENQNVVAVFTGAPGEKVQEHDDEVTKVLWTPLDDLPPAERFAFGHYDIIGMYQRHQAEPFQKLPIVPSSMDPSELLPEGWRS